MFADALEGDIPRLYTSLLLVAASLVILTAVVVTTVIYSGLAENTGTISALTVDGLTIRVVDTMTGDAVKVLLYDRGEYEALSSCNTTLAMTSLVQAGPQDLLQKATEIGLTGIYRHEYEQDPLNLEV